MKSWENLTSVANTFAHLTCILQPLYLGKAKKVIFQQYYSDFRLLRYLRRNKLQLLYCSLWYLFTSVVLLFPTICVGLFYGQFFNLWLIIFKANNANPQLALFRVTNIWRNTTLPALRCKSFIFYKVVWWHFSGVVGKGVTVCFFPEITNNLK